MRKMEGLKWCLAGVVCLINRIEAIQLEQHPRDLEIQFKSHLGNWQITFRAIEPLSLSSSLSGVQDLERGCHFIWYTFV